VLQTATEGGGSGKARLGLAYRGFKRHGLRSRELDTDVLLVTGSVWPRNDSVGMVMLRRAAEAGNVEARLGLAYRQFKGLGIEEDCDKAFKNPPPPPHLQPPSAANLSVKTNYMPRCLHSDI